MTSQILISHLPNVRKQSLGRPLAAVTENEQEINRPLTPSSLDGRSGYHSGSATEEDVILEEETLPVKHTG